MLVVAGTFGNVGRNELIGPDLQTMDLAVSKTFGLSRLAMGRGTLGLERVQRMLRHHTRPERQQLGREVVVAIAARNFLDDLDFGDHVASRSSA